MTLITWENLDGSIDAIDLDIYETETHDMPCEPSAYPVEKGVDVSDNVLKKPKTLTLEGYVSESPMGGNTLGGKYTYQVGEVDLSLPPSPNYVQKTVKLDLPGPNVHNLASAVTAGFNALTKALGANQNDEAQLFSRGPDKPQQARAKLLTWPSWESHCAEAFRLLEKARDTSALCQVVTDFKTYESMIVTSVQVPRKVDDGTGASFSVAFTEIGIVSAATVAAPKPTEPLGQQKKTTAKSAKEDPKEQKKRQKTALRAAALGVGL